MLRRKDNDRLHHDNVKLGVLTALSAGMVNVTSVVIFFSFTSNVTGHYAILAQELSKGNWFQAAVVMACIFAFFFGNFVSNIIVINFEKRRHIGHAIPIILEIICLLITGLYLQHGYKETLKETELLVTLMLFAMGLQNGLTASISNFSIKTTHLTGLTTDLGILFSLFTKREHREDKSLVARAQLLMAIMLSYLVGGVMAGVAFIEIQNNVFFLVSVVLALVIAYDFYFVRLYNLKSKTKDIPEIEIGPNEATFDQKRKSA